ncbi:ABC transporter substrate-binding protein [Clostridia bacterium]|nr:ABC transporter substrate-binding protein [Clostridia bacterium]
MRKHSRSVIGIFLAVLMLIPAIALADGTLVVYSPHDANPLNAGIALFEAAYPDIKVEVVAAGTGELLQRIAAEAQNPLADVLWGGGADSLAAFKSYFTPYVSANDDVIGDAYKDPDDLWIGESPLPMVIFYNKELVSEDQAPKTWDDLLDPQWKGKIAFASPAKSGSAFTQLCTMIFAHGGPDGGGWDFVRAFYANLDGKVQDSSGNCHKMVASGEYPIGVTLEKSAVLYADNPNVAYVYPAGNSAVPDGVALVKGGPNPDNAKLFIDFVTGLACQTEQSTNWSRRPVRSDLQPVGLPALDTLDLCEYDFDWAANNKEDIIEQWQDIVTGG